MVRLDAIDAARGLAVVFMIALHTNYGWLAPALRTGTAWNVIRSFGGLAAPLFLLLSGVSLALAWSRDGDAGAVAQRDTWRREAARGVRVLLLGYALRVQMWMIDAAGYRDMRAWGIAACLLTGYLCIERAGMRWAAGVERVRGLVVVGSIVVAIGAVALDGAFPDRVPGVFRVDVLQAIGASIALIAFASRACGRSPIALAAIGVLVAIATPLVERVDLDGLPPAITGYLVRQPRAAAGTNVSALFPLFPWSAYAFVGAALGILWRRGAGPDASRRRLLAAGALGALLAVATCELVPAVSAALTAHPWLTHPVRVGYRVGLGLVSCALCLAAVRVRALRWPLVTFGRESLLVYWVHLEFTFGVASRPIARSLDFAAWSGWSLALTLAMLTLAALAQLARSLSAPQTTVPARDDPAHTRSHARAGAL